MKIGLLGAGTVAQAFARHAIAAGHEVLFSNSRGPESLTALVESFGRNASAGTMKEAARLDVVLLAVPWPAVEHVLKSLDSWQNQVLIDSTNAFDENGRAIPEADRSSQTVSTLAQHARVVKAMNASFMENFEKEPRVDDFRRVIFISGDDAQAVKDVADLFEGFGLAPVLLGSLEHGGRMQAVGNTLAGHDFFVPWPAARHFPAFNGGN